MSKLLKFKFLLGVAFVAVMFVGVVAVSNTAAAACSTGTTTLRVGSTGPAVVCLQTAIDSGIVADGKFGPLTQARVMAWQTEKGLVADGVFGAKSRAVLEAGIIPRNFPAGCTSNSGFSSTTGLPCTSGAGFPAGCTSASGFSSTTGLPCTSGAGLPAGCTSTAGYSTTTGVKCDTGVTVSTGLQGSVDTWTEGSPAVSTLREGDADKQVLLVEAELANEGDVRIEKADIYFGMDNALANTKPWMYFKNVSLTIDGVVVATLPTDTSSAWTEVAQGNLTQTTATNQEYRLRFSGFSTTMKSNTTVKIGVNASAVGTIDSTDQDAVWDIGVVADSFKVVDGSGFATNDGSAIQTDVSFSSTKEAIIDLRDATTNPDASVVKIDATEDTNGVEIYQFEIEESNNVAISKIETITATFTTTIQADESEVIRRAYLYDGSTLLGSESVAAGGAVTFDNLNFSVNADSKKVITVKVDLDDVAAGLTNASTIKVGSVDITKFTDANGNDEGDIAVTATGDSNTFELRTSGIRSVFKSASKVTSFTADAAGEEDQGTYKIVFDVTAFGADEYIDASSEIGSGDGAGQGIEFLERDTAGTPVLISDLLEAAGTVTGDSATVFKVVKDTTRTFTLTVVYAAEDGTPGSTEVYMESINWGTSTADDNANYYTFDMGDYKTGYLLLNEVS